MTVRLPVIALLAWSALVFSFGFTVGVLLGGH